MWISLRRLVAPATSVRSRLGSRQRRARSSSSAAFALPSSATAVTITLSATPPSASATTPAMRLAEARGVSRMRTVAPSAATAKGVVSEEEIFDNFSLHQPEQQQQHDRRDV